VDFTTIAMFGVLALLVLFMIRNGRKRQKDAAALQAQVVPGAHVMTTFGVYGDVLLINDDENKVIIETSPGHTLTMHRQAIARVVEPGQAPNPTMGEAVGHDVAELALDPESQVGQLEIDRSGDTKPGSDAK
jgi:preprotein translocase subunit YajC